MLRHTASLGLVALTLVLLGACSDDDSDSPAKDKPDASADAGNGHVRDAGHRLAHDAEGQSSHPGGARDAAAGDASTHHRMDGGSRDASAPRPDAASSSDDDGGGLDCETSLQSSIALMTKPGSVLLIFDRSFSMADDWNGMPRWQAAGSALISALTPIQDSLDVGVILFPSVTPLPSDVGLACGVDAYDSSEQIAFQPAATVLQKLKGPAPKGSPNPMYAPVGSGSSDMAVGATPTSEAVDAAYGALAAATFSGPVVTILITDGEPNCTWDQTRTTDRIAAWRSAYQIDTYVVLLAAAQTMGQTSMAIPVGEALATAGGTTLVQPSNASALQQALSETISRSRAHELKSCSIEIAPPAERPADVQLVVTERASGEKEAAAHDLGDGSGWTISKNGAHAELTGALCDDAKNGRFASIELAYGCASLASVETDTPHCTTAGTAYCGGACIDVASDENNCGACDQRCGGGLTCCGGQCVDTTYNASNCGVCGGVCTGLCCGGECRPNDASNCGSCDNVCSGSMPCCCQGQCYAMTIGTCSC